MADTEEGGNFLKNRPLFGVYGMSYRLNRGFQGVGRKLILDSISFEIARGEVIALLGPNGSGKSTLMKLGAGVLPFRSLSCTGQVRYLGQDFLSVSAEYRARNVVYVASDVRSEFLLTAQEVVFLGRTSARRGWMQGTSQSDAEAVRRAMDRCSCWDLRDRNLSYLSGGERQLVALACALAQGAKVLFLDEIMSQMDIHHQATIGRLLKDLAKEGFAILLVSHDLNLASEWADSIIFLKEGKKIFHGPVLMAFQQETMDLLYPHSNLKVGLNPLTGAPKVFFGQDT